MSTEGLDPPPLGPALLLIYNDFLELSTERQIGMVAGPIPSSAIAGRTSGWLDDDAEAYRICIRALDAVYLERPEAPGEFAGSDNPARDAFRAAFRKK